MKLSKAMTDSAWNALDYGSTLLAFLITTKVIIGALGVEGYGFYTLFMSFIYTLALADLGVGMAISKYLSEYLNNDSFNKSNEVVTFGLAFYSLVGIALLTLSFIAGPYVVRLLDISASYGSIASNALLICAGIVLLNLMGSVFLGVLIAKERWRFISLLNISTKILTVTGVLAIGYSDMPVANKITGLFFITLLAALLKLTGSLIASRRSFPSIGFRTPSKEVRNKVLHYLKHTTVQYGLSSLVGHFDKILISRFYGLEATAYYGFVVNVFVYLYGFLANMLKIYFPKLSMLHGLGQMVLVLRLLKKIMAISILLSAALAIVVASSWHLLISIYIDEQFAKQSFAILLAFLGYLFVRSSEPVFSLVFTAIAKPQILVKNVLIGAPVTVISYFVFVPVFGVIGFVAAQIAGTLAVIFYNIRQLKLMSAQAAFN